VGRVLSAEHCQKLSLARKGKPSPLRGRRLSAAHVQKVADANRGRKRSDAEDIRQRLQERNQSEELRKLNQERMKGNSFGKGRITTEEQRERYRAAAILREMKRKADREIA